MSGMNVKRWLMGGIAAGILTWFMEGIASVLYMDTMEQAMMDHNLVMEMSA